MLQYLIGRLTMRDKGELCGVCERLIISRIIIIHCQWLLNPVVSDSDAADLAIQALCQ
jgi:hypothetical protein